MASSRPADHITSKMLRSMPANLRIAWAAMVCERVLRRFSSFFRKQYHQTAAIECALNFAASMTYDGPEFEKLAKKLQAAEEAAEAAGYHWEIVYPAKALLLEINEPKGRFALQAVGYATVAYAHHQAYRQGFTLASRPLPAAYYLDLSIPAHDFSLQLFDMIRKTRTPDPDDAAVRNLDIDSAKPLPPPFLKKILASKSPKPPTHEVKHLRAYYGAE